MPITSINQLDPNKTYTYADYLTWQFKERVELWRGRIARMAPAPNRKHQEVSGEISFLIKSCLRNSTCRAYVAPFDVRLSLPEEKQIKGKTDTVVQPDICVVCDLSKLDEQGCNGAPELVIEILSPGNTRREMKDKYELYETAGVQEYWLVHPTDESVTVYYLNEEEKYYGSKPFVAGEHVQSKVLAELELLVEHIFAQ